MRIQVPGTRHVVVSDVVVLVHVDVNVDVVVGRGVGLPDVLVVGFRRICRVESVSPSLAA